MAEITHTERYLQLKKDILLIAHDTFNPINREIFEDVFYYYESEKMPGIGNRELYFYLKGTIDAFVRAHKLNWAKYLELKEILHQLRQLEENTVHSIQHS